MHKLTKYIFLDIILKWIAYKKFILFLSRNYLVWLYISIPLNLHQSQCACACGSWKQILFLLAGSPMGPKRMQIFYFPSNENHLASPYTVEFRNQIAEFVIRVTSAAEKEFSDILTLNMLYSGVERWKPDVTARPQN